MVGEAADMLRKVDRGGLIPDGWLLTLHAQGLIEYRVKTGWTLSKKGKDAISSLKSTASLVPEGKGANPYALPDEARAQVERAKKFNLLEMHQEHMDDLTLRARMIDSSNLTREQKFAALRAAATTLEQMDEEYQKNKDRERRELDRRC